MLLLYITIKKSGYIMGIIFKPIGVLFMIYTIFVGVSSGVVVLAKFQGWEVDIADNNVFIMQFLNLGFSIIGFILSILLIKMKKIFINLYTGYIALVIPYISYYIYNILTATLKSMEELPHSEIYNSESFLGKTNYIIQQGDLKSYIISIVLYIIFYFILQKYKKYFN